MRSDNDGWDDGYRDDLSFDEYREEHPAHPIQSVAGLVHKDLLQPWDPSDPPQPASKPQKCSKCFKQFSAKAVWFCGKWHFSALCLDCADGNMLPTGFLAECKRPPVRQMSCPRCGITRGVAGTLRRNLWEYELDCPNCGDHTILLTRIRRICAECAEDYFVSEIHPRRICAKCYKTKSGSGPY